MTPLTELESMAAASRHAGGPGAMRCRIWGVGPPLVLLHGASGSWNHWVRNIPALSAGRQVIAPDMPGFGDSGDVAEPHTADALADRVAAGLDALAPPRPFHIAGFSFGGIIGGLLAIPIVMAGRTLLFRYIWKGRKRADDVEETEPEPESA